MGQLERLIQKEVIVPASTEEVWEAWTTSEGVKTFFAPDARVEPRVGGSYELYFDDEQPPGLRGSEGCTILEFQPRKRLVFTWNFPPHLTIRHEHTRVEVLLEEHPDGKTWVRATQTGWQEGPEWDKGFAYFERAWGIVLERLQKRFASGPIDWKAL